MLICRRKTQTKVLIIYSFSLYLIVSPTELFESPEFLKSSCAHRCEELFGINLAAVFQKHPGSVEEIQNKLVLGITDFLDLTDREHSIGIS